MRDYVLKRDLYLCQECLKKGKLTPAKAVHHIIHLSPENIDDARRDNVDVIDDGPEYEIILDRGKPGFLCFLIENIEIIGVVIFPYE